MITLIAITVVILTLNSHHTNSNFIFPTHEEFCSVRIVPEVSKFQLEDKYQYVSFYEIYLLELNQRSNPVVLHDREDRNYFPLDKYSIHNITLPSLTGKTVGPHCTDATIIDLKYLDFLNYKIFLKAFGFRRKSVIYFLISYFSKSASVFREANKSLKWSNAPIVLISTDNYETKSSYRWTLWCAVCGKATFLYSKSLPSKQSLEQQRYSQYAKPHCLDHFAKFIVCEKPPVFFKTKSCLFEQPLRAIVLSQLTSVKSQIVTHI